MLIALVHWLEQVSILVVFCSITLFVIVNGAFAAGVIVRRDRALVNRWTSRVLAIDLALLGAGLGAPAVAAGTRFAARTVVPAMEREWGDAGFIGEPRARPAAREAARDAASERASEAARKRASEPDDLAR